MKKKYKLTTERLEEMQAVVNAEVLRRKKVHEVLTRLAGEVEEYQITRKEARSLRFYGENAVKYRNREDHNATWTGIGRPPKWFAEFGEHSEHIPLEGSDTSLPPVVCGVRGA